MASLTEFAVGDRDIKKIPLLPQERISYSKGRIWSILSDVISGCANGIKKIVSFIEAYLLKKRILPKFEKYEKEYLRNNLPKDFQFKFQTF